MFCFKCGEKIKEKAGFCTSCGSPADGAGTEQSDENPVYDKTSKRENKKSAGIRKKFSFFTVKTYITLILILAAAIVFTVGVFQISGCINRNPFDITNETTINVSTLEQQILSIGELSLIEYNYRTLISMQDSHRIGDWNIPLTQKSFLITVDGRMKLGIDASEITVNASEQTQTVSIKIPRAKILSHEIFEDTMVVYEESSGLFNRVSITDWSTMAVAEKEAMEIQLSETDALERAENDAIRMLQAFTASIIPEGYTVNVSK